MSRRLSAIHKPPILGYHVMASRAAVAVPWYLAGGVSAANCIAAYQPIGAASADAAKVNLANPGTFTAYPEVSDSWNATDGWSGTYYADIVVSADYYVSYIIRSYDNGSANIRSVIFYNSLSADPGQNNIYLNYTGNKVYLRGYNATGVNTDWIDKDTTYCIVPGAGYYNGSLVGTFAAGAKYAITKIKLTASANTKAIAVYITTPTSDQVAALTTAMNALTSESKAQSLEGMLSFEPEEEKLWWQGADVDVLAQAQPQITQTWWDKANRVVNAALAKAKKFIDDKLYQLWQAIEDYFTYDEEE